MIPTSELTPPPNGTERHETADFVKGFSHHAADLVSELTVANPDVALSGKLGDAEFYAFYRSLLAESTVSLSDDIQDPTICLEIMDGEQAITAGTLGNFMLVVGKAKSRKTYLLSAIVAAFIKNDTVIGKLRGSLPDNKRTILYFDTEQHKGHIKRVLKRIALLSDQEHLDSIQVYHLKKYSPDHRLNAIRVAIEDTSNLGLIVIDGIRDTVFDINDAKEATHRATDLLQWTEEREAHLITVIHENKGNGNARGHLGSELVNKAETVISVGRDPADKNVSVVTAEYCRDREFEPFGFSIGEDELPYSVDHMPTDQATGGRAKKPTVDTMKAEDIGAIVRRSFSNDAHLRYTQLRINVIEASEFIGVSLAKSRAEEFIRRVEAIGYLIKFRPANERYESYKLNADKLPHQLS